jgi:hydrogenase/urease accessory protein HupE
MKQVIALALVASVLAAAAPAFAHPHHFHHCWRTHHHRVCR